MKLIKHLLQTVLLLIIGVLIYQGTSVVRIPTWFPYVLLGIGFIVGISLVCYTLLKSKTTLLSLCVIFLLCSVPELSVQAQSLNQTYTNATMSALEEDLKNTALKEQQQIEAIQTQILIKQKTVCAAPKSKKSYSQTVLADSYFIIDTYEKTNAASSKSPWATLKGSELNQAYKCAKEYLNNAAKVKKRNESAGMTVAERIINESNNCWPCDIAFLVLESTQAMVSVTTGTITYVALMMLGIFSLFWLAFRVLKLVGQMGYANNSEFFSDLFGRFVAVVIAAVILQMPIIDFYRITLSPLIGLTGTLTSKFSEYALADTSEKSFNEQISEKLKSQSKSGELSCSYCKNAADPEYTIEHTMSFIPVIDDQTTNTLLCIACSIYTQLVPMTASGRAMYRYAGWDNDWDFLILSFPDPFLCFILGLALIIGFSLLMFLVAFKIIDIFIRLSFVIVLTPLFVTAWAFPFSRQYAERAWQYILFSLFEFLALSVVTALLMNLFIAMLPDDSVSELINAMTNTDVEKLYEAFTGENKGGAFYTLLALATTVLIGFFLIGSCDKIVSALTGISPSVTGLTESGAVNMLKKGAAATSGIAGALGLKKAGKNLVKGFVESAGNGMEAFVTARKNGASFSEATSKMHERASAEMKYGALRSVASMKQHWKDVAQSVKGVKENAASGAQMVKKGAETTANAIAHPIATASKITEKVATRTKNMINYTIDKLKQLKISTGEQTQATGTALHNISQLAKHPKLAAKIAVKYGQTRLNTVRQNKKNPVQKILSSSQKTLKQMKYASKGAMLIANAKGKRLKTTVKTALDKYAKTRPLS